MTESSHRERLEALRGQLEQALATCSENMLPQLAGQYRATLADIAALPDVDKAVSKRDELGSRRSDRVADAETVSARAAGGRKRG